MDQQNYDEFGNFLGGDVSSDSSVSDWCDGIVFANFAQSSDAELPQAEPAEAVADASAPRPSSTAIVLHEDKR